jgi:hypothetical protein
VQSQQQLRPSGQKPKQAPEVHAVPDGQTLPHVPQFWGSVWNVVGSTHVPAQFVVPLGHPHFPWEHAKDASGQQFLPHFFPLGQGAGLADQATPGMEANAPPTKAAPSILEGVMNL